MNWLLWSALLIAQNASFTLVSRARNSKSLGYHAWASVLSNGIWFASQFILVEQFMQIMKTSDWQLAGLTAVVYIGSTMVGSLGMHYIAMNKIEKKESK